MSDIAAPSVSSDIIHALIMNIAVPEALMAVRWLLQRNKVDPSQWPTDAEVRAMLPQDILRWKSIGQAFLDATRGVTP